MSRLFLVTSGLILFAFSLTTLFMLTNVKKTLNVDNISAIAMLKVDKNCLEMKSFDQEVECIQSIQSEIFNIINVQYNYSHLSCQYDKLQEDEKLNYSDYEPKIYITENGGCCVLRSRFLEKALIYYGFETRHLAIYRANTFKEILFSREIISHSTTEVKTSKGWMYVDSVDQFIGLTKNNNPITASDYKNIEKNKLKYQFVPHEKTELFISYSNNFNEWNDNNNIWNEKFNAYIIYGLHSRHGNFYWPKLKIDIPDINWNDFKFNFI